jgi:hypothetical protein
LKRGRYEIIAKDEERYPDPTFLLCRDSTASFPEVTMQDSDLTGIRVVLGAEGGLLEIHIRDEATREDVPGAKAIIRDARNPAAFVEVTSDQTGHLRFTVPDKPIVVSAYASDISLRTSTTARS